MRRPTHSSGFLEHLGPGLPPPLLVPCSHMSPLRPLTFPDPPLSEEVYGPGKAGAEDL